MSAVRQAALLTGRQVGHWRRQPGRLALEVLFPVLLLLMFGVLLGGAISAPGGGTGAAYRDFLVPGMLALAMLFGLESTMTGVATDASRGVTDRFRTMPISSSAVIAGRATADMLASAVSLTVMIAVGLAVGWRPDTLRGTVAAVALLLLLRWAALWAGVYLGLLTRDPQSVVVVQILVWPFSFLSSAFVPVETMPAGVRWVAEWNPLTAVVTAVRDLSGSPSTASGWPAQHAGALAVAWCVGLAALFFALSAQRWSRLSR